MKNLFTFQETKITQQESYYINFVQSKLLQTHWYRFIRTKKIQVFLSKLILQENLKKNVGTRMFFIAESQQNTILNSSLDSL